ncbi:MAG: hypothetical protein ABI140_18065 [Jatrophihabitantaceae bacterium]
MLADPRNWDPEVWAVYTDRPGTGDDATVASSAVPAVGYVTGEFDAAGVLHSDGRLYPDREAAARVAGLRNASEGDPVDLLDRWIVFAVIADTPEASAALAAARTAAGTVDGPRGRRRFSFGNRGKASQVSNSS